MAAKKVEAGKQKGYLRAVPISYVTAEAETLVNGGNRVLRRMADLGVGAMFAASGTIIMSNEPA